MLGRRVTNHRVLTVENEIDEEVFEEVFLEEILHTRGNECQSDAEQFQAFAACQLTLVVFVAVFVDDVTRIDLNTVDVSRERSLSTTYKFLLERLMNTLEIVLQVHFQRDLLRCQTPYQTNHFFHVLILQERVLRDGIVYAMGD